MERTLTVDFTPTLVRDINHKELSVEPGDRACLAVEMSGGRVKWFKEDTEVKDDPGFRVETVTKLYKEFKEYEYEGEVKDATSYLRIRDCKPEDSGIYTGRIKTPSGQQCISSYCKLTVAKIKKKVEVEPTLEEDMAPNRFNEGPLSEYELAREERIAELAAEFQRVFGRPLKRNTGLLKQGILEQEEDELEEEK